MITSGNYKPADFQKGQKQFWKNLIEGKKMTITLQTRVAEDIGL